MSPAQDGILQMPWIQGCFDLNRIWFRIYSDEFFVNFVSFCLFLNPLPRPGWLQAGSCGHPVAQFHLVEVDDQPQRDVHEFHVAQELRFVDRQDFLHPL
jgi:hypothetical protein